MLQQIQLRLKAPKGQFNAFGKYRYRSLEDINEAVKPLLQDYKLALVVEDDLVLIGERYYIKATARLVSGDGTVLAQSQGFAREEETKKGMDASQITGSCSSYARKYALNGLLCLDDNRDVDAGAHDDEKPSTGKKVTMDDLKFAKDAAVESVGQDKVDREIVVLVGHAVKTGADIGKLTEGQKEDLLSGLIALSESNQAKKPT